MTYPASPVGGLRRLADAAIILALAATTSVACSDGQATTGSHPPGTGGSVGTGGMGSELLGGEGGMGHEACFSPSKPEDAYANGATGCACSGYADQSICVGGTALICEDDVWISAEDGPCEPRADDCAGITDTWQSCLARFGTCSEVSAGGYCGRDPLDGVEVERPACAVNYDWSEQCSDLSDGLGSQIIEGCGYTWIRAHHVDSIRNTIVDADGTVIFQQWDDPLSSINPLGCRGGEIPECHELPDDVSGEWNDVEVVQRGDQCLD